MSRVLTLTGPGGVGKTRLAHKAARDIASEFADGVRVIELGTVSDPGLLIHVMAAGLGLRDLPDVSLDKVIGQLRGKSILMVLDNCEHLAKPCGMLAGDILAAAPLVRILATSRQVLGIEGEYVLPVAPLAVLPDAIKLLTDRVAAVDPEFEVGPDNRDALVAICRRLDGIPLAIELVATWFRVLAPEEILRRLDDQLRLPSGHSPTRPARQRTLAASASWSYELCSPAERALWARLSVFHEGFTLEAAAQVTLSTQDDLLDLIAGLVDKSILRRDDENVARYLMLETVRAYGLCKLAESGYLEQVRRAHQDLLGLADASAPDSEQDQLTSQSPPAAEVLTKRELEIADLLADGASNKEIAASLVISPRTATTHVRNILQKLGFTSRVQVVGWRARTSESW
ncbi:putative ATPase [Kibdelosporangium banguiense]|uniref:ATPase n=1 Tax=Kibdelosporangium banguiense TaxID=1365924 RepID=A0ABS4TRA3_9PSEU|nr:LuxR C-terminal-related transcriptional regulator [Kibdelosporangium banguiense]MBP2326939.1 putative ATPase [Kibdelosporangium banguiense]